MNSRRNLQLLSSTLSSEKVKSIELRGLKYFVCLARVGNFGRASRELSIGQPALTRQIKKLEETLGVELLIRHGRGVNLTDAGLKLLERVEDIVHLLTYPVEESPWLQTTLHRGCALL
jgi:DNA-binding transcriptional LysR family regulator